MYISDRISKKDVKSWKNGDIITISAGTGAGKSYFVKNIVYEMAKEKDEKILFLIHRRNCVDQFKIEIETDGKDDVIDVKTYQSIEYRTMIGEDIDFSEYAYIVNDEFHYFLSDASFSATTNISLELILKQSHAIRIFMSATGEYMQRYLENYKNLQITDYPSKINFDFIRELSFYTNDKTVEDYIEECLQTDDKMIIFIQSAKKAYELHEQYKDFTIFNCGKSSPQYKYVDEDRIETMLYNEWFNSQILITTTVMDAGVNITDKEVKHIVIDVDDVDTMIQCLGRRINKHNIEDKLFVYIKNISNNQLGGKITQIANKLRKADYFKEYGEINYAKMYGRDPDYNTIVYDMVEKNPNGKEIVVKKLNELMFFKGKIDIIRAKEMIEKGYMKVISELLNKRYTIEEKEREKELLDVHLESIIDKKLFKEDQEKLIAMINLRDYKNRLQKSFGTIENYLESSTEYRVIKNRESSRKNPENYRKTYWKVVRV